MDQALRERRCEKIRVHNMGLGACFSKKPPQVQELPQCNHLQYTHYNKITLNIRPSQGVHKTKGNLHLLTYTQDLCPGAHNTIGGINIYQLQLVVHNMKHNKPS